METYRLPDKIGQAVLYLMAHKYNLNSFFNMAGDVLKQSSGEYCYNPYRKEEVAL